MLEVTVIKNAVLNWQISVSYDKKSQYKFVLDFHYLYFYFKYKPPSHFIHEDMIKKANTFLTLFQYSLLLLIILVLQISCYDLDNYNAAIDIVIPSFASVILQEVSPGDAPLIFRT